MAQPSFTNRVFVTTGEICLLNALRYFDAKVWNILSRDIKNSRILQEFSEKG